MSKDFGRSALQRIEDLEKNGVRLSMVQKLLLAETGTVEQVLSIMTGSPVIVKVTSQVEKKGIVKREALLVSDSGAPLIRAWSKVYCRNLPPTVVEKIRSKKEGIGTAIFSSRLETFRRITRLGIGKDGAPYRAYRIFYRGKVAFEIKEEVLVKGGPGGI